MATQIYTKTQMKLFINPDKITKQQKIALFQLYSKEIGDDIVDYDLSNVAVKVAGIDYYIKKHGIVLSKYFTEYNSTIIEKKKKEKKEREVEKKEKKEKKEREEREERESERNMDKDEKEEFNKIKSKYGGGDDITYRVAGLLRYLTITNNLN
jgi:hypothetical protein